MAMTAVRTFVNGLCLAKFMELEENDVKSKMKKKKFNRVDI